MLHESAELRASPGEVRLDEIAVFVAVATGAVPRLSISGFNLARQDRPQVPRRRKVYIGEHRNFIAKPLAKRIKFQFRCRSRATCRLALATSH